MDKHEEFVTEECVIEETLGKIYLPVNINGAEGIQIVEIENIKIWDDKIKILHPESGESRVEMIGDDGEEITVLSDPNVIQNKLEVSGATLIPVKKETISQNKIRRVPPHMQPKFPTTERYNCPNCTSNYSQLKNLQRHLRLECGQEPKYPCPYCNLKCKRNNQLQHHIASKHHKLMNTQ